MKTPEVKISKWKQFHSYEILLKNVFWAVPLWDELGKNY